MFFSFPVLMYHSISRGKHRLCVSPELFEEHCRTLSQAGWRGLGLDEAEEYFLKKRRLPRKTCLFTFDDGYLDNYVYAEPLLRRYGHRGAIFPVAGFVDAQDTLRPNLEHIERAPEAARQLPPLDSPPTVRRNGLRVRNILFCNWRELEHMHHHGCLSAAPHSLTHARVVRGPAIRGLYRPGSRSGFFGVPPFAVPYGFPRFELGHALADRAYVLVPELFELIRNRVPQAEAEAAAFLKNPENRQSVLEDVARLPCLGTLESEASYRARVAEELARCRELFMREIGHAPVSFCWPWGNYSRIALEEARNAGYRVFFSTGRNANPPDASRPSGRITVRQESGSQVLRKLRFASNAATEGIYGWLDRFFTPKPRGWKNF